jgi:DNA-binding SARP family transcriptional activator
MGLLRISLFGTVRIVHDDWSYPVRITPKTQALLAYLLLQGQRLHPREKLAGLFWGDYPQERARGCLSTTLWRLRRALEPDGIPPETYLMAKAADEIGFNWESPHWLDVVTFEEQVTPVLACSPCAMSTAQIQALESVLRLYTGDLLEGLYDEWVIPEQERLRSLYLDCLQQLMGAYRYRGLYEESLGYGRRILELEPPHEAIHREMMRIYLDSDQRALAVRQYEICRDVLSRQLEVEPMEETTALYVLARNDIGDRQVRDDGRASMYGLQPALKQLRLAVWDFSEAQRELEKARQHFQQAQQQFQQALKLIERLI